MKNIFLFSFLVSFMFLGCAREINTNIAVRDYPIEHSTIGGDIAETCQDYYAGKNLKVAVMPASNNDKDKEVAAYLEDMIVNLGGVDVYSRTNMDKVIGEIKLQNTGVIDEKNAVEAGKIAGVKYIIIGEFLNSKYKQSASIGRAVTRGFILGKTSRAITDNDTVGYGVGAAGAATAQVNVDFEADIKVKIIDVKTGKILHTKVSLGKARLISKKRNIKSILSSGIKAATDNAIANVKKDLAKYFSLYGYVVKTRIDNTGKDQIAMINLGRNKNLKAGEIFNVYTVNEVKHPITHKAFCEINKSGTRLVVSNQIKEDYSWAIVVEENEENEKATPLKTNTLIGR